MKTLLRSFLSTVFLVVFAVAAFAGPTAATQVSVAGFHLVGNTGGAIVTGVKEVPVGFRETQYAGQDNFVGNYPKLAGPSQAQQLATARAQAKAAQKELAKLKAAQKKAKASQP